MLVTNNSIIPMLMYTRVRGDPLYKWNSARKLRTLVISLLFSLKKYKARAKIKKFFPGKKYYWKDSGSKQISSEAQLTLV